MLLMRMKVQFADMFFPVVSCLEWDVGISVVARSSGQRMKLPLCTCGEHHGWAKSRGVWLVNTHTLSHTHRGKGRRKGLELECRSR